MKLAKLIAILILACVVTSAGCDAESGSINQEAIADGFGTITGNANNIDSNEILSAGSFIYRCSIDFGTDGYDSNDFSQLSTGGQEIINDANTDDLHDAFAYEILYRTESAVLIKTCNEIDYNDIAGKKTDFLVSIDGYKIGVKVARGYTYPPGGEYSLTAATQILQSNLFVIQQSSSNVTTTDKWIKQILLVISYDDTIADTVQSAWTGLDSSVKGDTILYIVSTGGDDAFLY